MIVQITYYTVIMFFFIITLYCLHFVRKTKGNLDDNLIKKTKKTNKKKTAWVHSRWRTGRGGGGGGVTRLAPCQILEKHLFLDVKFSAQESPPLPKNKRRKRTPLLKIHPQLMHLSLKNVVYRYGGSPPWNAACHYTYLS